MSILTRWPIFDIKKQSFIYLETQKANCQTPCNVMTVSDHYCGSSSDQPSVPVRKVCLTPADVAALQGRDRCGGERFL